MRWALSHRFDPRALPLADRHYSRQKPGTPQFVAPGSPVVLLTPDADALWVSLAQAFADHDWPDAWVCSFFRNEAPERYRSSELILDAVAATLAEWGAPPPQGMVTFVDESKVRHKRDPGRCFRKAGFRVEPQRTRRRQKLVLRLRPEEFPPPSAALGSQLELIGGAR